MRRVLLTTWALVGFATVAGAGSLFDRPRDGRGSNFQLLFSLEAVDYDLDPRGAADFTAAGLDLEGARSQYMLGVGWAFARPVRLDMMLGGGIVDPSDPALDVGMARAVAAIHLALLETRWFALEGTASLGGQVLSYRGLPDDAFIPGGEVGLGGTLRARLFAGMGLALTYRWQQARFQRATIELSDETTVRVHPTAGFHTVRIAYIWDL